MTKKKLKVNWFEILGLLIKVIPDILDAIKKTVDPDSDGGKEITPDEGKQLAKGIGLAVTQVVLDKLEL